MDVAVQVGLLALGFVLLVKGADWFVEGASRLAEKFGIPQLVIGLTIVAMGTSLPEAAVSVSAALKGSAEITIGNIVGSNIMNILLILGLTALITPIAVQKSTVRYEIPFVIVVSVILVAMGVAGDNLLRLSDGLILWALMLCYLGYLLAMSKRGVGLAEEMRGEDREKPMPVWKMLALIVLGGAMIVLGSDVAVDAATELAMIFGMSERLIGLTIVAFGTSLPERHGGHKGQGGYRGREYCGQQYFQYPLCGRHFGADYAGGLCAGISDRRYRVYCGSCAFVDLRI